MTKTHSCKLDVHCHTHKVQYVIPCAFSCHAAKCRSTSVKQVGHPCWHYTMTQMQNYTTSGTTEPWSSSMRCLAKTMWAVCDGVVAAGCKESIEHASQTATTTHRWCWRCGFFCMLASLSLWLPGLREPPKPCCVCQGFGCNPNPEPFFLSFLTSLHRALPHMTGIRTQLLKSGYVS